MSVLCGSYVGLELIFFLDKGSQKVGSQITTHALQKEALSALIKNVTECPHTCTHTHTHTHTRPRMTRNYSSRAWLTEAVHLQSKLQRALGTFPCELGLDPALLAGLPQAPGYARHVHRQPTLPALHSEVPKYYNHIPSPGLTRSVQTSVLG